MEAKELMAGDIVKQKNSGLILKVSAIVPPYIRAEGEDGQFHEGTVEPIPLAKEVFEQNGFKKFNFRDIEGQHQWTWWIDTLTSVSLWCRELNDNPKEGWMVRIDSPLASHCSMVEFLHQLQQTLRLCRIKKLLTVQLNEP